MQLQQLMHGQRYKCHCRTRHTDSRQAENVCKTSVNRSEKADTSSQIHSFYIYSTTVVQ
jgi:hypothetical protein